MPLLGIVMHLSRIEGLAIGQGSDECCLEGVKQLSHAKQLTWPHETTNKQSKQRHKHDIE